MNKLGDIPLKTVLAAGLLSGLSLLVFAIYDNAQSSARNGHSIFPTLQQWLVLLLLVAAVCMILVAVLRNMWMRPLQQLLEATREGATVDEPVIAGRGELALLAHAITRMQRRHRRDRSELHLQKAMLTALLHRIHEGVIIANAAGKIELLNPAAERMLALRASTVTQQPASFVGRAVERIIPQHDIQRLLHAGRDVKNPAQSERLAAPEEEATLVVEHGKEKRTLFARAADLTTPGRDESAVLSRFVTLVDTTELSQALQIKADFVANASHELRTPLSTIRAAVETLMQLDLATESEDAARFVGLIDRSSTRLSDMVADLLDLSRVESPGGTHVVREIDIPKLLAETLDRFRARLDENELRWVQNIGGTPRLLIASPYLIQLILDNLLDNAIKFSPANGAVLVDVEFATQHVAFTIADEGCGIPAADQQRVFERFYQVQRARAGSDKRGTGLGLAIVKHSVNVLNGTIELESAPNQGTRVSVRLPYQQANATIAGPSSSRAS